MGALGFVVEELRAELIAQRHSATGKGIASLRIEEVREGKEYNVIGEGYLRYVNFGTRPHFPPLEPIRRWLQAIGADVKAAFPIARKMSLVGTPMQPYVFWTEGNTIQRTDFIGIAIERVKPRIAEELKVSAKEKIVVTLKQKR